MRSQPRSGQSGPGLLWFASGTRSVAMRNKRWGRATDDGKEGAACDFSNKLDAGVCVNECRGSEAKKMANLMRGGMSVGICRHAASGIADLGCWVTGNSNNTGSTWTTHCILPPPTRYIYHYRRPYSSMPLLSTLPLPIGHSQHHSTLGSIFPFLSRSSLPLPKS